MKKALFTERLECRLLRITGSVQGVGFRPFVYRIAHQMDIKGQVNNTDQGVHMIIQATPTILDQFTRLLYQAPPPILVHTIEENKLPLHEFDNFEIKFSENGNTKNAWILPDLATCPDCLNELEDESNRRYQYPFINCTHCGPRYSIITSLPYDRKNTTMASFTMCPDCQEEYDNPNDRRFHAQPNACPTCGPQIGLYNKHEQEIAGPESAIKGCVSLLKEGKIIAVKGIGGFQLLADAGNEKTINRLRKRKQREAKPFAVMFPNLSSIQAYCRISDKEKAALLSAQSPIVLLFKIQDPYKELAPSVAPDNPYLGAMLPYSPLHHLLMKEMNSPVICTSGNISEEPICIDNEEAFLRLKNIADAFLLHNRPIARHVDDSVVKTIASDLTILRRARGYAPLPITGKTHYNSILAVGGHLKNTISISQGNTLFTSQHIGDLETEAAFNAFSTSIKDLANMYEITPELIIHDKHPDYLSSQYAEKSGITRLKVQHHAAHIYSCMAEHNITPPVLGFAWDGTGYGDDETIWGGEAILINQNSYERFAHFLPFALPGGDLAVKEPFRTLIGLLHTLYKSDRDKILEILPTAHSNKKNNQLLLDMLDKNINCPMTSSVGRLFDAISSLLDLEHVNQYEGHAAISLEYKAWPIDDFYERYSLDINKVNDTYIFDWRPMILEIIKDKSNHVSVEIIAAKVHISLSKAITKIADLAGIKQIVISGGTFQNRYLTDRVHLLLVEKGYHLYMNRQIPPNDGGISTGQIYASQFLKSNEE